MLVTIPLRWRVVSVHRLYTATCFFVRGPDGGDKLVKITSSPPAKGRMSCSTVSDVNTASSPSSCAWMSCGARGYISAGGWPGAPECQNSTTPCFPPVNRPPSCTPCGARCSRPLRWRTCSSARSSKNLDGLDGDAERVRQRLDQPAARPPAPLPEPPGLLGLADVLSVPVSK